VGRVDDVARAAATGAVVAAAGGFAERAFAGYGAVDVGC